MTAKIFDGQAAIVTGAGVGIGYAVALDLAQQGAQVMLNDLDPTLAEHAAQQLRNLGYTCLASAGDVADVAYVRKLVQETVAAFGRLDMTVCNAGLTLWGNFFDYTPENFQRVVDVNLRGTFFLTQAAALHMREHGGGRIVLISSVTGVQAVEFLSAYAMSKAGLMMLARNLVLELAPHGITLNCVAPGATLTPRNLKDDPNYEQSWGSVIPTGKVIQPEDIAHAVSFLLNPRSSQITGQTIIVDGGWTMTSPSPALDFVQ